MLGFVHNRARGEIDACFAQVRALSGAEGRTAVNCAFRIFIEGSANGLEQARPEILPRRRLEIEWLHPVLFDESASRAENANGRGSSPAAAGRRLPANLSAQAI